MARPNLIASALSMIALVGCNGMLGGAIPGSTMAEASLRRDVATSLLFLDSAQDERCTSPRIADTQFVSGTPGAAWQEAWSVESCGTVRLYDVEFTPAASGGTDFRTALRD